MSSPVNGGTIHFGYRYSGVLRWRRIAKPDRVQDYEKTGLYYHRERAAAACRRRAVPGHLENSGAGNRSRTYDSE